MKHLFYVDTETLFRRGYRVQEVRARCMRCGHTLRGKEIAEALNAIGECPGDEDCPAEESAPSALCATYALIACSATKLPRAAPARELYQGTLFKHSVQYVEQVLHIPWYVLSAAWGLVGQDEILEPYSDSLQGEPELFREIWAREVAGQLDGLGLNVPETTWVLLAGKDYRDPLIPLLRGRVETPLAGMGIGRQIAQLKAWIESAAGDPADESEQRSACDDCTDVLCGKCLGS
jgi:hypothetical protein